MITATAWVPRGFAAQFPTRAEFNEEEFERIAGLAKLQLDDARAAAEDNEEDGSEAGDEGGDVKMDIDDAPGPVKRDLVVQRVQQEDIAEPKEEENKKE